MVTLGVDLSEWQKGIDIKALRKEGSEFFILRGSVNQREDYAIRRFMTDAQETAAPLSLYHYLMPDNAYGVRRQAEVCSRVATDYNLPVWVDVEQPGLTGGHVKQFISELKQLNVQVLGVYSRHWYWISDLKDSFSLADEGLAWWISEYPTQRLMPAEEAYRTATHLAVADIWNRETAGARPTLWQFTDQTKWAAWHRNLDCNATWKTVQELADWWNPGSAATGRYSEKQEVEMVKEIEVNWGIVPQETGYWCGPATVQLLSDAAGVHGLTEQGLAGEMGTDFDGTDHIGLLTMALNRHLPGVEYKTAVMPHDPPTGVETELLWERIVAAVDNGLGVACNIVAPPSNYPRGVYGSVNPAYAGGTVYHYIAAVGYRDGAEGRAVKIADPGFRPFSYWVTLNQLASLIPPKGYSFPNVESEDFKMSALDKMGRSTVPGAEVDLTVEQCIRNADGYSWQLLNQAVPAILQKLDELQADVDGLKKELAGEN